MRPAHRHAATAALVIAGLATGGLALRHRPPPATGGGDLPVRRAPAVMPAAPRLAWRPVAGAMPIDVNDYTLVGDTLVVLDRRGARVHLLRLVGGAWRTVGGWGRTGAGPGEFRRPTAVARTSDGAIAVLEESGRIQRFDLAGRVLAAERAMLPCTAPSPTLAYGPGDVRWLAGSCAGRGDARDTIFTVLFRAEGAGEYAEVRRMPRMAIDLAWGSVLGTLHPLSDAGDAVWFGTGLDDCAWRVPGAEASAATPAVARTTTRTVPDGGTSTAASGSTSAAAAPRAAERHCALVREWLGAPPPPDLERQRRDAERRGQRQLARLLRWPATLPAFISLLHDGDRLLLVRPLGADSLALVPAGEPFDPRRARLVAPLASFVTCTRGTCLWYDRDGRLALHREHATPRPGDAGGSPAAPRVATDARGTR